MNVWEQFQGLIKTKNPRRIGVVQSINPEGVATIEDTFGQDWTATGTANQGDRVMTENGEIKQVLPNMTTTTIYV